LVPTGSCPRQLRIVSEPVIFLTVTGWAVVYGAEITTNLLLWKVCRFKFNYSAEICSNLSAGNGWRILWAVLNFTHCPRGEICLLGGMFTPSFTPLCYLEEWRGKQRISLPGYNFTSRGQNSLLGDNFAPGG
jgi:hypothetical protein